MSPKNVSTEKSVRMENALMETGCGGKNKTKIKKLTTSAFFKLS